jgi:hypothetical protein
MYLHGLTVTKMADPTVFLPAWLRELGSIAGLLSLGFVVYDRFFKDRPHASVTMGDYGPQVLITNPSSTDITITGYRVFPAAYGIARDDSMNNVVSAAAGEKFSVSIKSGSEAMFPLITKSKDGRKQTEVYRRGVICLFWRKNSSLWLPQIPLRTSYHVSIIASLRKDH